MVSHPLFKGQDQEVKSLTLILYLHLVFIFLKSEVPLWTSYFILLYGKRLLSALILWIYEFTLFSKLQQNFVYIQSKMTPIGFGILWARLSSKYLSMSLLFDFMASKNLELEFWPIRQDRQVMKADIWASAHCVFPSENHNDLEDGAQQSSHCRLGSQLMLPMLFRMKSQVPCGPKALSTTALC